MLECIEIKYISFQELLDCFDNDFENNEAWNLEHNAEKLQEIVNSNNAKNYEYNYLNPSQKAISGFVEIVRV